MDFKSLRKNSNFADVREQIPKIKPSSLRAFVSQIQIHMHLHEKNT